MKESLLSCFAKIDHKDFADHTVHIVVHIEVFVARIGEVAVHIVAVARIDRIVEAVGHIAVDHTAVVVHSKVGCFHIGFPDFL